ISAALTPQPTRNPHALTVSVMPSVASSWLIPRLPTFTALHPEVELNLQSTSDVVDFDREDVDVAVRFGQGGWPEHRTHLLVAGCALPLSSPELLRRFPQAARGDFTGVPLLRDLAERWHAWFERFGGAPPARWVAAFDDTDALQRAAMEGMGVALGRLTMARPLLESGRLVALTRDRLPDRYSHYLVYPPRSENHPALVAFRTWILGVAASEKADAVRPPKASGSRRARRGRGRRA